MTVYYYSKNQNGYITGKRFSIDRPAATVMAHGIAGDHHRSILLADDGKEDRPPMTDPSKPPYRVPLMSEIAAVPWNGLTVVSTFAGCGGSSTGYRMAGFRVLLANEFVPIAQESYAANMGPHTVLAREDVKALTGAAILKLIGLEPGELDVLDGSPPCQAFSTAGRREKGWGTDRKYEHGASQRNEDLFDEFTRLLRELRPRTFVAENVSGLVKGVAKGYFLKILAALKDCGYSVVCRKLDAQWLGVPQARERVIFVGVRADLAVLGFEPAFPVPLQYRYSVRDALPWLGPARLVTARNERHTAAGRRPTWNADTEPSPTIMATPAAESYRVVHDMRGSFKSGGDITDRPSVTILSSPFDAHHFQVLGPIEPETDISRYAIGAEYDRLNPGQTSDKYFSLKRADADQPCLTITAAGGQNSSLGCIVHPTEKRKFTIAEVKRLSGFPDDFILKGTFGQQWERLGNAVPPVMAMWIASAIRDAVLLPCRQDAAGGTRKNRPAKRPGGEPAPARAKRTAPARRSGDRSKTGKPPKGGGR